MKKKNIVKICTIGIAGLIFLTGILYSFRNQVSEILRLETSISEEYYNEPKTLDEWIAINEDVWGVLKFESDGIQHVIPIVNNPTKNDWYMKHNVYGDYDTMGTVFIDENSPLESSNNLLINGHASFKKDWNFTFLKKYAKKDYFEQHKTFVLEDENGEHKYNIVSFAEYDIEHDPELYLGWFDNMYTTEEAVSMFKLTEPYILQRTSGFIYSGQQIMTLITCNMKKSDSRFVLMAIEMK